LAPPSS